MPFTDLPPTKKRKGGVGFLIDEYLEAMAPDDAEGARRWLASAASSR